MPGTSARPPDDGIVDHTAIRLALAGRQDAAARLTQRETYEAITAGVARHMTSYHLGRLLGVTDREVDRKRRHLSELPERVGRLAAMSNDEFHTVVDGNWRNPPMEVWLALTAPPIVARTRRALVAVDETTAARRAAACLIKDKPRRNDVFEQTAIAHRVMARRLELVDWRMWELGLNATLPTVDGVEYDEAEYDELVAA